MSDSQTIYHYSGLQPIRHDEGLAVVVSKGGTLQTVHVIWGPPLPRARHNIPRDTCMVCRIHHNITPRAEGRKHGGDATASGTHQWVSKSSTLPSKAWVLLLDDACDSGPDVSRTSSMVLITCPIFASLSTPQTVTAISTHEAVPWPPHLRLGPATHNLSLGARTTVVGAL